jgi:hypothetical protein
MEGGTELRLQVRRINPGLILVLSLLVAWESHIISLFPLPLKAANVLNNPAQMNIKRLLYTVSSVE